MPLLNEREYAKLAAAAAKDLVEHQIPLNESVDKLAQTHDLNADQLSRLCEATNNSAFNALFEQRSKQGSDDRLVEFDVAAPAEILKKRVSTAKTASYREQGASTFDAAWESRPLVSASSVPSEAALLEKIASSSEELIPRAPSRRAMDKTLEHLRIEKLGQLQSAEEALDGLVTAFKPMYSREKYASFECECMALYGPASAAALDYVRSGLRMEAATRNYEKVAALVVVSDTTPEHGLFKTAFAALNRALAIQTTLSQHGVDA